MSHTNGLLVFENGVRFEGTLFGAVDEVGKGEVVFNTSMTGYQEILTDPSYYGQIVVMTYPLIGNYGTNQKDVESRRVWASGLVVRELSGITSNYESEASLEHYLKANHIIGISGVDTRMIVRMLRDEGAMRGLIAPRSIGDAACLKMVKEIADMNGLDLAKEVTDPRVRKVYCGQADPLHVVAVDYGMKENICRMLLASGMDVTIVPATATADDIMKHQPDGIFLSNGPGDPFAVTYAIDALKTLSHIAAKQQGIPLFGICLGHQLLALALGAKTYKLKFGHHGGNHPVRNLDSGRIEITAQNHGFAVDERSLPKSLRLTHRNLYDNTVEGICHKTLPIFSVQYHPEAAPGPHDSQYLFAQFRTMILANRKSVNETFV